MCFYPSTVKDSSVCNDVLDIFEGTDQRSCVEGIIRDTSANSLHLSFSIYISPPKTKFRPIYNSRKDIYTPAKRWYIDIGNISWPGAKAEK